MFEKIAKVLEIKGINPTRAERLIGVSQGTLSKALDRKGSVHDSTQEKFTKYFHVKPEWWETGKGEIFEEKHTSVSEPEFRIEKGEGGNKPNKIPFYDVIAVGGEALLADQIPNEYPTEMIEPGTFLKRATGSLRIYGHSMFPKYPAGCIVAFKDADKEVIIWGEDYVIELSDRRIIKRVEKGDEKGWIKAVSYNKSEEYVYSPIDIPVAKIKRLYMVLGKVELEASI